MNYINEAIQTKSDQFHGELVSAHQFKMVVTGCIAYLQELDKLKKAIFYGRGTEESVNGIAEAHQCTGMFVGLGSGGDEHIDPDIVHAIIGKATESGELLEALMAAVNNRTQLDTTNIVEELGDGQWYDAILANALGVTFEHVQTINISKLRGRYPDKFTEYDAMNRDLAGEREILEGGAPAPVAATAPAIPSTTPWAATTEGAPSESEPPKAPKAKK